MSRKRFSRLAPQTFVENQVLDFRLPDNWVYSHLLIEVEGSLAITGLLTPTSEAPWNIVDDFSIVRDGVTLQTWPGGMLSAYNFFMNGQEMNHVSNGVAINDPDPFRVVYCLPFKMVGSGSPAMSLLDPKRYNSLFLRVTCAPASRMFSAGAATLNAGCSVRVSPVELLEAGSSFGTLSEKQTIRIQRNFASANTAEVIQLPKNKFYRGLLVRASTTASAGLTLSDAVINNMQVRLAGNNILFDGSWQDFQNLQQLERLLTESRFTSGIAGSRVLGYSFIDFIEVGASDFLNPGNQDFELVLDVDAGTRVDVIPVMAA